MICPVYIYFVEEKKIYYDVILITNNIVFKCVFTYILRKIKRKKIIMMTVMKMMMMHPEIVHEMLNYILT